MVHPTACFVLVPLNAHLELSHNIPSIVRMAGTRRSARHAGKSSSNPSASQNNPAPSAGSKRKADSKAVPKAKRGRKGNEKEQTTIEATMRTEEKNGEPEDDEMKDDAEPISAETSNGVDEVAKREEEVRDQEDMGDSKGVEPAAQKEEPETNGATDDKGKETEPKENGFDVLMNHGNKDADKNITEEGTGSKVSTADNAIEGSQQREEAMPSSILEKGVIYFFFRGRVGINEPSNVSEIARSYIVLRPIPIGTKLGEGPIGDERNIRMLSLPKKVLPVSPKDRFMMFVEKTNTSLEDVKQQLSSSDYSTKTAGVRHTPAATPIGEGVYAIIKTGQETHLAYILTIPSEIGEVQQGVGLRQRGSYLTSTKNPTSAAPANASLPQGPKYPKEYAF